MEELFDLEAARKANASYLYEDNEDLENALQSCGDLPGQLIISDDYISD